MRAAFPEHAIVGKEAGEIVSQIAGGDRAGSDTLNGSSIRSTAPSTFVHGFPYYAVSIALTHGDDITHAVVLDPVHDELFTAIKGKGAQRNGAPIRRRPRAASTTRSSARCFRRAGSPKLPGYLPVFNALVGQCAGIRRAGACALDLAHVAAGRLDGFWVMSLKAWDVAAGALLVGGGGRPRRRFRRRRRLPAHQRGDRRGARPVQSAARGDRGGASAA